MLIHSVVLILHVGAAFFLAAVLAIEVLSLVHLRRASTLEEARPWIEPAPKLPIVAIGSALTILISGIYLVIGIDAAGQAWPKVAFASFLLMGPLSAMTGRRMRALRAACGAEGSWSVDLFSRLRDPILKMSLSLRVALFISIFVLVSAKPGPVESLSLIGTSVLVGLASSVFGWRGGSAMPQPISR